ncbi:MAG: hypothetical protein P8M30_14460 [Planctomycetaceae bacterium]|jgi:hypothetical protein|nr:hypothetical protein [Planctomycetaceae bacterium]
MNSRPLQIAFTALTLSLVVSISLWIVHASHKQIDLSNGATLQMPSVPAQIDHEHFGDNFQPDPFAEPFTNNAYESVSGELPPRGLETATVSKRTVNPMIIDVQEQLLEQEENLKTVEAPTDILKLPTIDLSQQTAAEFPPAQEPFERPVPPAEALDLKPLDAPEPPAWLSVQATLEEEIEELRNQQRALNESLKTENQEAELFKSQNDQLSQNLKASQEEIKKLQASMEGLRSETNSLKSSLAEKADQIDELENDLKESQAPQVAEKTTPNSILEIDPAILPEPKQPASLPKSSPLPPLPNRSLADIQDSAINQELKSLYGSEKPTFEESPRQTAELPADVIVPLLTGQALPPLPQRVVTKNFQPQPKPLIEAEPQFLDSQVIIESPYYEPVTSQPMLATTKKRGLIYQMKDWFHNSQSVSESCSDCEPLCTDAEICTKTDCAAPIELIEPTCGCPQCTAANQWIQEEEMLSHQTSYPTHREGGLIPQMKNWWTHHKQDRNVRYEPAIVGRPANATILPAAHVERTQ